MKHTTGPSGPTESHQPYLGWYSAPPTCGRACPSSLCLFRPCSGWPRASRARLRLRTWRRRPPCCPWLHKLLLPYFTDMIPSYEENRYLINAVGDFILLASLFVLGGDFWDKLKSLFIYGAKAISPPNKTLT